MAAKHPGTAVPPTNSDALLGAILQRCEDEPIRIPGSIQRHGFLLLLNASESHIVGASENTEDFLEVPLQLVLGAEIDSIFEREVLGALRALAHLGERPSLVTYLGAFQMRGRLYSVVTHQVEDQRIVEFELLDRLVSPDMTNQVFTNFVGMLSQLRSQQELCDALTRQVRDLTHYNRVMLYSFDEFGHGTVLSEENDGSLPSYLGLRFPTSDIPQQARDLYVLNTVRIIPDATYIPSPLHGTDLTDRRQREAALRMTEKLALTGRMTSVIAHEINNPLESLTNLLYLLTGHVAGNEEARNYIALAESELQRISGITKQTLRWAREDLLRPEYALAGDLIRDVLRLYAGQIRNKEVEVFLENQEDVSVYGTLGQISQVLANLIANALQATPVGGRIWLNYAGLAGTTEFTVRDNGHGMSEETQRNLFQPFYGTKGDLGNGLGLYISHEIVERHHGTITIQSLIGKGTDIRVCLPTNPVSKAQ